MIDLGPLVGGPLKKSAVSLTLVDMQQPDQPLIFVNEAFTETTGYTLEECVGRNCRFLQGPDTNADAVAEIHNAIENREKVTVDLLNYRKDGSSFYNRLKLYPLLDDFGNLIAYCGVQIDLGSADYMRKESEADRLANILVGDTH